MSHQIPPFRQVGTEYLFNETSVKSVCREVDRMFCVYVLYSPSSKRFYVGQTADISRRLKKHNEGSSRSTRSGRPWQLVYNELCSSRTAAIGRERFLKSPAGWRELRRLKDSVINQIGKWTLKKLARWFTLWLPSALVTKWSLRDLGCKGSRVLSRRLIRLWRKIPPFRQRGPRFPDAITLWQIPRRGKIPAGGGQAAV